MNDTMNVFAPATARLETVTHRSGNTTYRVFLGKSERGVKKYHSFKVQSEAEQFISEWNAKLATQDKEGLSDLDDVQRAENRAQILRCRKAGITLKTAVDFYFQFNMPQGLRINIKQAIDRFIAIKHQAGKSQIYLSRFQDSCLNPFRDYFLGRLVADITPSEAEEYIRKKGKGWSPTTKADQIMRLTVFYNSLIKANYARINPFKNIEKPKAVNTNPKPLEIATVKKLLNYALDTKHYEELAIMALVLFCGVRQEEASKVKWEDIDLKNKKVSVSFEIAKKRKRRVNAIPENALVWLTLAKAEKKSGVIMPVKEPKQRLKRLRKRAGVTAKEYSQNGLRHSFASYHVALHQSADKTALMLGHVGAVTLYQNYLDFVTEDDAKTYFDILPAAQEAEKAKQKAEMAEWMTVKVKHDELI